MLSDINEPGPGFEYFLNTPCQEWDAVKYLEALENCKFALEKATVSRRFKTQLREINAQGTEEEKKNAIRLEDQFNVGISFTAM
jgi:hypothetical protein